MQPTDSKGIDRLTDFSVQGALQKKEYQLTTGPLFGSK